VVLGTGVFAFLPMLDCGRLPIIRGAQGGYHVWGSIRARYVDFRSVVAEFAVEDRSGNPIAYPPSIHNPIRTTVNLSPLPAASLFVSPLDPPGTSCPDGGEPPPAPGAADAGSPVPDGTDGWGESLGLLVFLPTTVMGGGILPAPEVDGRQIRIELTITDSAGRTARDAHTPVPNYAP
jgi:hypothetical protein